jgi:hypothetical protein
MRTRNGISEKTVRAFFCFAPLAMVLAAAAVPRGQAPHHGVVAPLTSVKLESDGQPACLKGAGERRSEYRAIHVSSGSRSGVRGALALSHGGRTIDRSAGRCVDRDGRHVRSNSGPWRLRHDARQGHALVHLPVERRLPDVRDVRQQVRHRVGQAAEVSFVFFTTSTPTQPDDTLLFKAKDNARSFPIS